MDILAARKKAAERAKKKKETPAPPAPVAEEQRETPQAPSTPAAAEPAPAPEVMPVPVPAGPASEAPAPSAEEHVSEEEAEEAAEPVVQELETLAFRLGSEEYVVMVEQVKEVLKLRDLTPVPHAPEYVPGVISLRGAVLPVIDLARRLSLAPGVRDEKSRIMVVSIEDEDAGLIVDRVLGVVRFLPDAIQHAPEAGERGSEFLKGIVRKEGKLYILLDLEKAVGK